jgi:protease I
MKKAIILCGENVQDQEWVYPYYRLQEEGFDVNVATKDGKETKGIIGIKIPGDTAYDQLKVDDYELLVLPGGVKMMEKLRQEEGVLKFIADFVASDRLVASTCHGAQLLISAKSVKGRKISAYYSIKDDVNNAGATYVDAPFVTDGNIVSSPHYKHMAAWMKETIRLYNDRHRD